MGPGRFGNERPSRGGRWLRWAGLAALVGVTGLFAFQLGVEDERGRTARQAQEADQLREANQRLESSIQQLQADHSAALSQLAQLGDRMAAESVPGVPRELVLALKPPLDAGIDPQRIQSALAALAPQAPRAAADPAASPLPKPGPGEECEAPETKKFLVRTPISREQPSMSAGFGGGAVAVSATGASLRNAENKIEAWFDPKEPVTVRVAQGGKTTEANGKLPLQQTVTVGPVRYRFVFALAEGSRGFIQVTADRCKAR